MAPCVLTRSPLQSSVQAFRPCVQRSSLRLTPFVQPGSLWTQRCSVAVCKAVQNDTDTGSSQDRRLQRTLSGLDSLLGIPPEAPASSNTATSVKPTKSEAPVASTSTSAPEASKLNRPETVKPLPNNVEDQFKKIIDKARQLADDQSKRSSNTPEVQQQELRQEFETLLETLSKNNENVMSKDELKKLKDACFGPMTFWVTETATLQEADRSGILVRGNLRDDRDKIFTTVCAKVKELFDGKYEVIMVEDTEAVEEAASPAAVSRGPRVAFQIVNAAQAQPPQSDGLKQFASFILFLLFSASSLQLALVANITKLPKETLEFFQNADKLNSDALPPGLETWDPSTYFVTAIPIFVAVLLINFSHELGHRIAALIKGVRLGPTYFVPNLQLGSFGAVTPFTSLLKNRNTLWDVAAAGPLAGFLASAALLVFGLLQSEPGVLPKELLVPVPTQLFQGSLLLGTIAKAALGADALRQSDQVLISPFVVAGWCGMITTALNLLPVGSLDGGRMIQAAYGRQALALSSFFTYVGLGLGFLGSSLALPFGIYVVICQREAEKFIQDNVSPTDDKRRTATAVAVLTAILILVPMAPELAESLGVGQVDPFL